MAQLTVGGRDVLLVTNEHLMRMKDLSIKHNYNIKITVTPGILAVVNGQTMIHVSTIEENKN